MLRIFPLKFSLDIWLSDLWQIINMIFQHHYLPRSNFRRTFTRGCSTLGSYWCTGRQHCYLQVTQALDLSRAGRFTRELYQSCTKKTKTPREVCPNQQCRLDLRWDEILLYRTLLWVVCLGNLQCSQSSMCNCHRPILSPRSQKWPLPNEAEKRLVDNKVHEILELPGNSIHIRL